MTRRIARIGWIIMGIAALVGAAVFCGRPAKTSQGTESFVPVEVARERLDVTIETTGVVEPRNRIEIKPPIGGRMEEVLVAEGQEVRQGEVLARMSSTDRAALLDAARAQGEDALKKWSDVYRATPLLAPLNGTVIARKTEPGQTLTAADVAFVLSDTLIVRAQVDETDIGFIRVGQPVILTLDAYPDTRFRGTVSHIAYDATTINNVTIYKVEIIPQDAPPFMKSGMTTTCRFVVESAEDALTIPVDALIRENGDTFVWLAPTRPGAKPERRKVRTGLTGGGRVQIVEGLDDHAQVVRKTFDLPQRKEGTINPFMPRPPGSRR